MTSGLDPANAHWMIALLKAKLLRPQCFSSHISNRFGRLRTKSSTSKDQLMGNPFIPFPRCENIIIVGDAAAEYLGALRIYGRGLIGGDVPSMELLHPMEKHLECVSCF